jgi:hypothetical protein
MYMYVCTYVCVYMHVFVSARACVYKHLPLGDRAGRQRAFGGD